MGYFNNTHACRRSGKKTSVPSTTYKKGSYKEILAKAKTENKPILIYVCAKYCMESNEKMNEIMESKQVSSFLRKNFICKRMEASGLLQQAKLDKWGVTHIPSFIYLNPDGELINIDAGCKVGSDLIIESEKVIDKYNGKEQNQRSDRTLKAQR